MSDVGSWEEQWSLVDQGQRLLEAAANGLTDDQLRGPSALPDWTRGHVLSHVARNADALINLLTWARTGVETPMYPSREARASGIEAGAGNPSPVHASDVAHSAARLRQAADELPTEARSAQIKTAQGRPVTALEVPWMRNREVWLHHIDLGVGFTIDQVPDAVATRLAIEVAEWMSSRIIDTFDLLIEGHADVVRVGTGTTATVKISGSPQQVAGWLTGRVGPDELGSTGEIPQLPPWL